MKLLLAALHHPTGTARYMTEAFARLGHDIRHIGYLPPSDGPYTVNRWHPDGDWDHVFPDWTPDLVIYADTIYSEWRHSTYTDAPHVTVCTCNNVCNMSTTGHEHYFVAHKYSKEWPLEGPDMSWMPCGYDPTLHTFSPISFEKRRYDVCLIGAGTPPRPDYMRALQKAGLRVVFQSNVWGADYVVRYHDSRMSLCVNEFKSPMMRYFESAAMGCLILGDECLDLAELGADGWIPLLSFGDVVDAAQFYLDNPDHAKTKIMLMRSWVKPHRWDDRAQQIIDWYEGVYSE